ncbi:MAG: hypothetical protein LBG80_02760 [Bacteroidales bacterium]|jgi:hypothetical protein|nr:hypothetical protein [Bacteroidales bacterium]
MKTKNLFLLYILFWIGSFSLSAQSLVSVNQTINKDTIIAIIQSSMSSKTVVASGQADFFLNQGISESCFRMIQDMIY